jgi:predicted SPOUT superfamily RNA methylase MTH1
LELKIESSTNSLNVQKIIHTTTKASTTTSTHHQEQHNNMPRPTKKMKLESVINAYDESSDEDLQERVHKRRTALAKELQAPKPLTEEEKRDQQEQLLKKKQMKNRMKRANSIKNKRVAKLKKQKYLMKHQEEGDDESMNNEQQQQQQSTTTTVTTTKSYISKPYLRANYTVSVALPGSVLKKEYSDDVKSYISSQIARILSLFRVDEIIVFNEYAKPVNTQLYLPNISADQQQEEDYQDDYSDNTSTTTTTTTERKSIQVHDPNVFLANILYYLEIPPTLRSSLVPKASSVLEVDKLSVLDSIHHLLPLEFSHRFREGVVVNRGNEVFVGKDKNVRIDGSSTVGSRVTVEILSEDRQSQRGRIVPSSQVKEQGVYWGYKVRVANSLSQVFTECPYESGYDVSIGVTNNNGNNVDSSDLYMQSFRHLLITIGCENGFDSSIEKDKNIKSDTMVHDVFNVLFTPVPNQGIRQLQVTESLSATLTALRPYIDYNIPPVQEVSKVVYPFIK